MFKRVLFFIKNILTKFRSIPQNDNNEQDIIKPESTEESPINNEEIEIPDNNPIPAEEEPDPIEETLISAEEETEAIEETTIPAEEETDPIEETTIPAEEETDPIEETTIPAEEEPDPIEETLIPAEEETDPIEETLIPAEEETDPIEETLIPAEEEPDPIEETTIPAEEEPDPIEETTIPAEEETDPIEETLISAEEETEPIEETLIPAEEEPDPIEETLISAEEETDPIEETLTSDDIECYEPEKIKILKQFIQRTDAHIFLTGKAGTGKTTFLRNLVNNTNKKMIVVAPTGVAAINAGGVTIHSFFQLPFGPIMPKTKADIEDGIDIQKFNRDKLKIIQGLDLLVIDEISMVRADLLDAIDSVLRRIRHNSAAFGGVQLLMIGDIQQLAPVAKQDEWELLKPYYKSVYFFDSLVLKKTSYICIELDHIYRQSDTDFIEILNKVRKSKIDNKSFNILNSRYIPDFQPSEEDNYITLTTHNYQADSINKNKLASLESKSHIFDAFIKGIFPGNSYPTKRRLELKVGAQVMFVKNDPSPEKRYYNGKIGKIVSFDRKNGVQVECDNEIIDVRPVTWHNFEYKLNGRTKEIEEKGIGSFTQIPLKTAWAITIHKSQGLTFEKVILDAEQAFTHGQVYVALSRCTSLDGLVLKTKLNKDVLIKDDIIKKYTNRISSHEADAELLHKKELDFLHKKVLELINFSQLEHQINKIKKIIDDNKNIFKKNAIDHINTFNDLLKSNITDASSNFSQQINEIFSQSNVDQILLQEKITEASIYFSGKLNEFENIGDNIHETDNLSINAYIKGALNAIREIIFIKSACFDYAKESFDVEQYIEIRNSKIFEAENLKPTKLISKNIDDKDKPLVDKLLQWREKKAIELNIEDPLILPKTLINYIAKNKPKTIEELKTISKFGATRIKKYGNEIIRIVLESQGIITEETAEEIVEKTIEKPKEKLNLSRTEIKTLELLKDNYSITDIVKERGLKRTTIEAHIINIVKRGYYDIESFITKKKFNKVKESYDLEQKTITIDNYIYSLAYRRLILLRELSQFEIHLAFETIIERANKQ